MIDYSVLQNQWMILTLLGGAALTLVVALGYIAAWRGQRTDAPRHGRMPWILTLVFVLLGAWGVGYVLYWIFVPANW
jgi:hypothetical protein